MSPMEVRASTGLAAIFGLRLFGMFIILPVFVLYAGHLRGGANMTLVGVAMGVYGLTQAILQIPYGWWSDRYGRKPVIYVGLAMFALGSFVAAASTSIEGVILGRVLQGAGAISGAVIAMVADLTREQHRTKAMAMVGSTIGLVFAISLVAGPGLNRLIGVPGIFALTGILALCAILLVWRYVPDPHGHVAPARGSMAEFRILLRDGQLLRLNYGIFTLHAILMAMFIAIPVELRDAGMPAAQHWHVYLPVMIVSFVLMLPAIMTSGKGARLKRYFVVAIALVIAAQLALSLLPAQVWPLTVVLLLFFTPFNLLEAMLPSLISRMAPPQAKGAALGIYSSVQFFGTFVGSAAGGFAYGHWHAPGVTVLCGTLAAVWLVAALGMKVPDRAARKVADAAAG